MFCLTSLSFAASMSSPVEFTSFVRPSISLSHPDPMRPRQSDHGPPHHYKVGTVRRLGGQSGKAFLGFGTAIESVRNENRHRLFQIWNDDSRDSRLVHFTIPG